MAYNHTGCSGTGMGPGLEPEQWETIGPRLHILSMSPYLYHFKMGSMQSYGAIYTCRQKD